MCAHTWLCICVCVHILACDTVNYCAIQKATCVELRINKFVSDF